MSVSTKTHLPDNSLLLCHSVTKFKVLKGYPKFVSEA